MYSMIIPTSFAARVMPHFASHDGRALHLLEASLVQRWLDDGGLRLAGDHAHALAHALHPLDDVVLPHVVDYAHHLHVPHVHQRDPPKQLTGQMVDTTVYTIHQ